MRSIITHTISLVSPHILPFRVNLFPDMTTPRERERPGGRKVTPVRRSNAHECGRHNGRSLIRLAAVSLTTSTDFEETLGRVFCSF